MKKKLFKRRKIKFMKKLIVLLLAVLAFGCQSKHADFEISLFHTNDIHGHALSGGADRLSVVELSGYVADYRARYPAVLFVDAGDAVQGHPLTNLTRGEAYISIMNLMGYDAMVPGNHEFDWGAGQAINLAEAADFPLLAANVTDDKGHTPFGSYIIKEFGNVFVAVVGLATPETLYKTNPNGIKGYYFADPVETLRAMMPLLHDEADIIVAVAHLGNEGSYTSTRLAREVDGIDVIVDGHDHTALAEGRVVGNTLIVNTGEYSHALGKVTLGIKNNKVLYKRAELLGPEKFAAVVPQPQVEALLSRITEANEAILSTVVAEVPVALDGRREIVRTQESLLGQLVADGLLWETGADIALMNGGGLRDSIPAGPVTKRQVVTVLPYGNVPVTVRVKGHAVKMALEQSLAVWPEPNGGFLHTAGLTYTVDVGKPAGQRIADIMAAGRPLDENADYVVALPDFIAAGGDGYTMFAEAETVGQYATDEDIFIRYLQSGRFKAAFTPRITWIGL
jgi:5'-nucleotidase/UDP-sugar diphosphatase